MLIVAGEAAPYPPPSDPLLATPDLGRILLPRPGSTGSAPILLPGAGPLLSIWLRPYHQAPTSVGASFFGHCRRICMAAFPIARLCRGLRSPITGTTSSAAFVAPLLQGQMLRLMTLWPCPSPRAGPFCFHGQSCPSPGKFCRLLLRTKPPGIDFSAFSGGTPFA
jgi:hypothetical protein